MLSKEFSIEFQMSLKKFWHISVSIVNSKEENTHTHTHTHASKTAYQCLVWFVKESEQKNSFPQEITLGYLYK